MIKYLMFFTCLTAFLSAEKIGNVEFQLPQGWKVDGAPQSNDKTTTIKYIQPNSSSQYFGAHVNTMKAGPMDDKTLEKAMQANNPGKNVEINVIDRTPNSVLFEWSVKNDTGPQIEHGWSRFMTTNSGNVVLMYRTKEVNHIDQLRPIWVKVLKGAKETSKPQSTAAPAQAKQ